MFASICNQDPGLHRQSDAGYDQPASRTQGRLLRGGRQGPPLRDKREEQWRPGPGGSQHSGNAI